MAKLKWRKEENAPENAYNLIVAGTITCKCGEGGKVVLPACRLNGQWHIEFDHSIDIDGWIELPRHPETLN
jgi:hypothetical protein